MTTIYPRNIPVGYIIKIDRIRRKRMISLIVGFMCTVIYLPLSYFNVVPDVMLSVIVVCAMMFSRYQGQLDLFERSRR